MTEPQEGTKINDMTVRELLTLVAANDCYAEMIITVGDMYALFCCSLDELTEQQVAEMQAAKNKEVH